MMESRGRREGTRVGMERRMGMNRRDGVHQIRMKMRDIIVQDIDQVFIMKLMKIIGIIRITQ